MQIIIVGCGKVGCVLAKQLSKEKHNITVIDTEYNLVHTVSNSFDVMGIVGNGASNSVQSEADIEHTDLFIAVTGSDELNLLCCVIAKKAGNCSTIARVRNPVYITETDFIRQELGLSMIINPEFAAASEMARLLRFPRAIEIDTFAKGRVEMLRFKVPPHSQLHNMALKDCPSLLKSEVLICAVERKENIYIPSGTFIIQEGDILSIIATPRNSSDFFRKIHLETNQVKSAMIAGGGEISYYLAKLLIPMGIEVKIIEINKKRCNELSELLPEATILHGDASDESLLLEEHIELSESFVALTDIDEENIILSLYAKGKVKSKVVTKINHLNFDGLIHTLDLDSIIYPKHITTESIIQYVRAKNNSIGSNIETLYKLMDDRVEALEFAINDTTRITGIPLSQLNLKPNLLIGCIHRLGKAIIPGGQDVFQSGDTVIVVTTNTGLQDVHDILQN
ncbi:MAG: Trk system potassium transporter TrkA [Lachnospiraceae bacterium]|nr:Trk system potassium transporter TrkA [Lachnospiraceae bacterium]